VYNAEESATNLIDQRVKDDIGLFARICSRALNIDVDEENIEKVIRLGKKSETAEEPRPMLVKLKSAEDKKSIFKNLQALKDVQDPFKNIKIDHDQTKQQRVELRTLVAQSKEKERLNAEGPFVYRVRGPPWNRRIAEIKKTQGEEEDEA
jgi:hypothetical protein